MVGSANFTDISANGNLIVSANFFKWNKEIQANRWFLRSRIVDYFDILSGFAFKSSDYVEEGISILRIGDIKKDGSIDYEGMNKLPEDFDEKYNRFLVKENDIAIAMTGATIGKTALFGKFEDKILLNQRVGILRKKENVNINVQFIQQLLRNELFQKQVYINSMGKSQPNISPFDILNLKIPLIDEHIQNLIVSKISPIEAGIIKLQKCIKEPLEIINEVFADYYGYSKNLWREFGKGMTAGTQKSYVRTSKTYQVGLSKIQNSKILRISSRFHNPHTQQLTDFLFSKPVTKVGRVIEEIIKGVQPKYDNEGEVPVIKIASLKNGYVDIENPELVKQSFIDNLRENQKVKFGDILLCCTGKISLGKIDLYEHDQEAVLSVDNYLIRLNEKNYNSRFLTYFFRSILGAFQIERDYTGATNQIHLYDKQVIDFVIPNIILLEQEKIVKIISEQLNSQKEVETQIAEKQNEISLIISEIIKSN